MEALERHVGCARGWRWRHQGYAIGVVLMSLLPAVGVVGVLFWCFCCWLWAGKCRLGISNLMTRFLLTNNTSDWSIYFVVIFCSIRLFFTVNITDFNNYLINIMKLQVFMVLWSVLRSPLVLGSRFVATSQFICVAGWMTMTGFCMVRVFGWWGFSNRF